MKKIPIVEICLIILGALLYFAANLQRVAVPGAMFDLLQADLHASAQSIASLGASFMYVYALSQLVIGILITRYGGFRVVTCGAVLFFIGCVMFPFVHSLPLLYFSRTLIGAGSASFYLGMINETRRLVPKKNFGVILSVILLIGYIGGIIANAPLVICINSMGWRETFVITAIVCTIISILFIILNNFSSHQEVDKSVHMNFDLYRETLKNSKNINLYSFACINYGLYYVLQTVIGKKFLEDFCQMSDINAAMILSIMSALYAIAGSVLAIASKAALNRRTIFLRISAINTLFVFSVIFVCLLLDIRAQFIGFLFCTVSFLASLSPLLVPLLHDINGSKVANTAVSVMTCGFYISVGLLGNIVGFFLDIFKPLNEQLNYLAINSSYIAIFGLAVILSIYSFVNVFKIEESKKTKRLIEHLEYIKHKEDDEAKWHDEYEHDIYTNI